MKKTLRIVLLICLVLLTCVLFGACDNREVSKMPSDTNEPTTEPHVHSFGEWTTEKEATCAEEGLKKRSCECGEKETQRIDKTTHTEVIDEAVASTCTATGLTEGKHCSVCNKIFIMQGTILAKGHDYDEWEETLAPTCTAKGSERRDCKICDSYETRSVKAKGHTDGEWIVDQEATCTDDGSKHQVCSVCSVTLKTETLTKLGHTDGEWIVDQEATCTEDGSKHQVCTVCHDTVQTADIAALGHTDGEWVIDAEATCTEDGSKHQICFECNATIKTETLTRFGHNYKENLPQKPCIDKTVVCRCQNCEDTYSMQLQEISANIDYCYWSYVDSTCYVQDVLSINGIQGGYGKYNLTITYTDPMHESHVYTYTDVTDLYTTKYLGDASWAAHFRQAYPPFVTIEIEDEIGFKTTYTAYFPTLNPDDYISGYNWYSQDVSADVSVETLHNYSVQYVAPGKDSNGRTLFVCSDCNHSKEEQWENITIDLNYSSNGYGMYTLNINNVSGGAIKYQDGNRVKNNYTISIVNVAVGYVENSGYISEETGTFSSNVYTVSTYCKYNIVISDGYSTYIFSTDYVCQYPVLRKHIVAPEDNVIRFSVSFDRHDSYDLYRLRIDSIYGGTIKSGSLNSYTITVKNLSDNSVNTYTDIKEFSGIVVGSSYSGYSNQKYEITISDGTYTYVYTTSIGNPTPTLNMNPLSGTFYSTGLAGNGHGFSVLLKASSNGGYGDHKYQLIVYDSNRSLVYEGGIQSSPDLVWETDFKSSEDFDHMLVVRIYDELGYIEYAAIYNLYNMFDLSPYLLSEYKFTNN